MPPDPTIGDYPSLKSSTAPDLTVYLVAKQYFLLLETASDLSNRPIKQTIVHNGNLIKTVL